MVHGTSMVCAGIWRIIACFSNIRTWSVCWASTRLSCNWWLIRSTRLNRSQRPPRAQWRLLTRRNDPRLSLSYPLKPLTLKRPRSQLPYLNRLSLNPFNASCSELLLYESNTEKHYGQYRLCAAPKWVEKQLL